MSARLLRLCCNEVRHYCTKIPTKSTTEESLKSLRPGDQATMNKLITNSEILGFAKLTDDFNPIHIKAPRNLVHGAYLNGLVSGVMGTKLPGPGTIVVEQRIRYPNPCYAGDNVLVTVEILSVRKIVTCKYTCVANMERLVLEGEAKVVLSNQNAKKISLTK